MNEHHFFVSPMKYMQNYLQRFTFLFYCKKLDCTSNYITYHFFCLTERAVDQNSEIISQIATVYKLCFKFCAKSRCHHH